MMPSVGIRRPNVRRWTAAPPRDGKTSSSLHIDAASRNTSTARSDSGTRRGRFAFARAAATVQVAASTSTSSHVASRASAERTAQSTMSSNTASLDGERINERFERFGRTSATWRSAGMDGLRPAARAARQSACLLYWLMEVL